MDIAQPDFPFRQSIELSKQVPETGFRYHWKAEVDTLGLTIRMWVGGFGGTPFETCVTRTINSMLKNSFRRQSQKLTSPSSWP